MFPSGIYDPRLVELKRDGVLLQLSFVRDGKGIVYLDMLIPFAATNSMELPLPRFSQAGGIRALECLLEKQTWITN